MAYGELGPTHSIEDLAWTRAIANLTVIVPADSVKRPRRRGRGDGRPCSCASAGCRALSVSGGEPSSRLAATLPRTDVTIVAAGVTVPALEAARSSGRRHQRRGVVPDDFPRSILR
jgi:transketolase